MITASQLLRVAKDWNVYAKETVCVEEIAGTIYGFGSELATLRLLKQYMQCDNVAQGYSENLKTFYFTLTPAVS